MFVSVFYFCLVHNSWLTARLLSIFCFYALLILLRYIAVLRFTGLLYFFSNVCISFIFPNCRVGFLWMAAEQVEILYLVRLRREKKRERKRKNLIRPGVNTRNVFRWSRSSLVAWAIAQSQVLNTTITVELICKRGC